MPRWEPNAVGRLQEAAFELFEHQGLEGTTVAEIARRAGLTERTFYNHFPTKTDVLFGPRSVRHQQTVTREIISRSSTLESPLDAVVQSLQAAADELFEGLRVAAVRRRHIIDAYPAFQEREHTKRAELAAAIAAALEHRGVDRETALLTARMGTLIEQHAAERWTRPAESAALRELLGQALVSLRTVAVPQGVQGADGAR